MPSRCHFSPQFDPCFTGRGIADVQRCDSLLRADGQQLCPSFVAKDHKVHSRRATISSDTSRNQDAFFGRGRNRRCLLPSGRKLFFQGSGATTAAEIYPTFPKKVHHTLKLARARQTTKISAQPQQPLCRGQLRDGLSNGNGAVPQEPPSVSATSADSNVEGDGTHLSPEELNYRGNINWRRRALQAAKGDESPTTASPPDIISGGPQRPYRIFLVRHGVSEGNMDESMYTRIPDSKISLTERGKRQAEDAGRRIREIIEAGQEGGDDNWMVYFYVSPYLRTLQTLRGIGAAFERRRIAGVREEPRLREQDFGNFQDREKMRVEKTIRLRFGRFFYRFPDGESAADVYDRVTGFRETLRTDIDVGRFQKEASRNTNMNLILVSHGLTLRVFLMRWFKWTVDQFQQLHNFGNAGFLVLERGPGGRYSLTAHHTHEELAAFGLTPDMIADQEWQVMARPGDLNPDWPTSGPSFFDYFENLEEGDGLKYPDRPPNFEKCIRDLEHPSIDEVAEIHQFPS